MSHTNAHGKSLGTVLIGAVALSQAMCSGGSHKPGAGDGRTGAAGARATVGQAGSTAGQST